MYGLTISVTQITCMTFCRR